jgi:hypothetical protein
MTDDELMTVLLDDHDAGLLASELVQSTDPDVIDVDRLEDELYALCRLIDDNPGSERRGELLAAYRALMWARLPEAFAPPSEGRSQLSGWIIVPIGHQRHIVPRSDKRRHQLFWTCWCGARGGADDPMWIEHRAADARKMRGAALVSGA